MGGDLNYRTDFTLDRTVKEPQAPGQISAQISCEAEVKYHCNSELQQSLDINERVLSTKVTWE